MDQQLSDRRRVDRRAEAEPEPGDVPRAAHQRRGDDRQRPPRLRARRLPGHARRQGAVARRRSVHAGPRSRRAGRSPSSPTRRCPIAVPIRLLGRSTSTARCSTAAAGCPTRTATRWSRRRRAASRSRSSPAAAFISRSPVAELLPIPLTLIVNNGAVVKRKTGETELRHVLTRDAARRVLAETRALRGQRRDRVRSARRAADRLRAHGLVAPEPARLLREEQGVHRRGAGAARATC